MIAAVVLAAGAATRYGSPKQLVFLPAVLERLAQTSVDEVEVGRRVAGPIRVAFRVDETVAATAAATAGGARVIAPPTRPPWGGLNARLEAPGGLQLTLFEEPDGG